MLNPFIQNLQNKKVLGIITLLVFAIYGKTLFFEEYVLDDHLYVTGNSYVKNGIGCSFEEADRLSWDCVKQNFKNIWGNDVLVGFFNKENTGGLEGGRLRPLSLYTFAIEFEIFQSTSPGFSHFINLILYSLVCWVIFIWLKLLFQYFKQSILLVFVIVILYLVHPLHVEVVANIKGRMELLSALFSFLFAYQLSKGILVGNTKNIIWATLVLFLGLLSKEEAITFLAIIPFLLIVKKETFSLKNNIPLAIILIPLLSYFLIRKMIFSNVLNQSGTQNLPDLLLNNPFLEANTNQKWGTIFYTFWRYVELLFIPHPLTHDYYPYHIPLVNLTHPKSMLGIGVVLVSIFGFLKYFKKIPLISFGILFFWATFSITSNVFFNVGAFMNERFMFLPSLGFIIVLVMLINPLLIKVNQKNKEYFVIALLGVFGLLSFNRSDAWESNFVLFENDVKTSSNSIKSNMEYAEALINKTEKRGDLSLLPIAQKHLKKAYQIDSTFVGPFDLSGKAYYLAKEYDNAAKAYLDAAFLALKNKQSTTLFKSNYFKCVEAALDAKQVKNLKSLLQESTVVFSNEVLNYAYLGRYFGEFKNDFNNSINVLETGLKLNPNDPYLLKFLFINYATMGQIEQAKLIATKAYEGNKNDDIFLRNLFSFFKNIGDEKNAAIIANQLKEINQ